MFFQGDARDWMATVADDTYDSIVTDPPYELTSGGSGKGFMGQTWDGSGIAHDPTFWEECLRVLKPGGHLLAFGGTRTYHRLAFAVEMAGFEIRESVHWVFGQGFPKSLNVEKAMERAGGDSAPWAGWGTALKPAHEPIVVARKPLVGTVAQNVLTYGTGALNIDGTRVGISHEDAEASRKNWKPQGYELHDSVYELGVKVVRTEMSPTGRWPANLVITHHPDCERVGVAEDTFGGGAKASSGFVDGYEGDGFLATSAAVPVWRCVEGCPTMEFPTDAGARAPASGTTRSSASTSPSRGLFRGTDDEAPFYRDAGSASRFFNQSSFDEADWPAILYYAKANRSERDAGLGGLDPQRSSDRVSADLPGGDNPRNRTNVARLNHHPTVKPVELMRHLVRLVTPPKGLVFDPFLGSGTTAVASILEGFEWDGCELTEEYWPLITGRVEWAQSRV